jgi:hypothetical protein
MPAGNPAGYGKYNDIMPRIRDAGGDNIRAMTGRPATMDEGQRQYMLNQDTGQDTSAGMTDDQQPNRAEMLMQDQQPQGMQAYADMLKAKTGGGRPPAEADTETQNRAEAMNMMMQQMQGVPQETDQRGAYLKALQDSLMQQTQAQI